ncbi:MAG TPA: hypothetical protein VFK05_37700, partial [Polyangiaceae bacterium]|nr:hypothetical protein [Polyangiaceae bacterium]
VHSASEAAQYERCQTVVGDLSIHGSDLSHLDAFAALQRVSGTLEISDNPRLGDVRGLERLESVGSLAISDNRGLDGLDALSHLESAHAVVVRNNPNLDTLRGFEGLAELQNLSVEHNGIINTVGLENLRTVGSLAVKRNSKLISLAGLRALEQASSIEISGNRLLAAYFGLLPRLQPVGGRVLLRSNDGLAAHEVREVLARVGHVSSAPTLAKRAAKREVSLR